jgi:hypothetical protein
LDKNERGFKPWIKKIRKEFENVFEIKEIKDIIRKNKEN